MLSIFHQLPPPPPPKPPPDDPPLENPPLEEGVDAIAVDIDFEKSFILDPKLDVVMGCVPAYQPVLDGCTPISFMCLANFSVKPRAMAYGKTSLNIFFFSKNFCLCFSAVLINK